MARTRKPANVAGPLIRRRRYDLGMTQEQFAARCQVAGFDISRATLSQIEAQVRCVKDWELAKLAAVLRVTADSLLPAQVKKRRR
jgi:transcriptional regulator with XRE-family HTH domain